MYWLTPISHYYDTCLSAQTCQSLLGCLYVSVNICQSLLTPVTCCFYMYYEMLYYRSDILMALHEQEVNDICSMDPSHKFAWCLDACIREHFVDSKRAKELQGFIDGIKKGQEEVLG